ncbi:hypothetical protein VC83_09668 [Pseudogymnoascus destructans]|uniref:Uncharacterized protein n=1 Tax=Pseudogymnoascus destructans TaxID=655981 RepID=A0A2P6FGN8_9PEZI|nr:uncharacterized protein VC83_09668 [Pseudogymnoascus destructans]PQM43541.1 hypothetical protein VC83_09668 [Pseudogymnoascus destructans]
MNNTRYEMKSLIQPLHYLGPTIATYLIYLHEPDSGKGSLDHFMRRGHRCHRSRSEGLIPSSWRRGNICICAPLLFTPHLLWIFWIAFPLIFRVGVMWQHSYRDWKRIHLATI